MHAVNAAMERAVGETALELESQMILLATAVSGSPFLGLLGTVWGVMDAFTGVAEAGSPSLASMAPGVSGALITEYVFGWPGVGRLFYEAATSRDYPLLLAVLTMTTFATILGTLLADVGYGLVDPRIRYA